MELHIPRSRPMSSFMISFVPGPDPRDAGVFPCARCAILVHVSVAAVDPHTVVQNLVLLLFLVVSFTRSSATTSYWMSNDEAAAALDGASSSPRWLHPEDVSGGASATVAMVLAETQAIPSGVLSEFSGWSNHACCACQLSRPRISSIAAARCNVCKPLITVCIALISELLATAILAVEIQFLAAISK